MWNRPVLVHCWYRICVLLATFTRSSKWRDFRILHRIQGEGQSVPIYLHHKIHWRRVSARGGHSQPREIHGVHCSCPGLQPVREGSSFPWCSGLHLGRRLVTLSHFFFQFCDSYAYLLFDFHLRLGIVKGCILIQ